MHSPPKYMFFIWKHAPIARPARRLEMSTEQDWTGLKPILAGSGLDRSAIFLKIGGSGLDRTEKILLF